MRTRAGKAVGFWHTGYKEAHRGCLERLLFNWRRISEKKIQHGIQLPFRTNTAGSRDKSEFTFDTELHGMRSASVNGDYMYI